MSDPLKSTKAWSLKENNLIGVTARVFKSVFYRLTNSLGWGGMVAVVGLLQKERRGRSCAIAEKKTWRIQVGVIDGPYAASAVREESSSHDPDRLHNTG